MLEIETCEHEPCGFNKRLLYCEVDSRNFENAVTVADVIDELLYEGHEITSQQLKHTSSSGDSISERAFLIEEIDGGLLHKTSVWLRNSRISETGADSYDVEISIGATNLVFDQPNWRTASYSLDMYASGVALGKVGQYNPKITNDHRLLNTHEVADMTTYDYQELFAVLRRVCEHQVLEEQDNGRSFRAQHEN